MTADLPELDKMPPRDAAGQNAPRRRPWSWLCTLFLAASVFGLSFIPLRGSQDEWWHLKTGEWIWQHGGMPLNDIFTYTGQNIRWYNHEWLSQLIFYGIYRLGALLGMGGIFALILFKSLVVVAVFVMVARLAAQRLKTIGPAAWPVACFIGMVAADVSRRTINPRPPIFSYLLFAGALWLLYSWKAGRVRTRWIWILVPMTVLWANLHGMVLLSIVAVGAFAGGEILETIAEWLRQRGRIGDNPEGGLLDGAMWPTLWRSRFPAAALLTLAVAMACMAQPSGYHIFFLGRNFTADPLLQKIILEMKPTPGPFALRSAALPWWDWHNLMARPPGFWTPWVAVAAIGILLLRNRLRLPYGADYLLLGFFTWQGIMHWRLLPLFAIASAAPAGSLMAASLSGAGNRLRNLLPAIASVATAGLLGWLNFTVAEPPPQTFFARNLQLLRGHSYNYADYPAPLMDYLAQSKLPPRMFSDSNYCGYAMWRLSPEHYKLFTDNRFDVFGSRFIREERIVMFALYPGDIIDGQLVTEGWEQVLGRYGVNFLVFRPADRPDLLRALAGSRNWRMIYYYIAPEAAPSLWPLDGYYVWVRESQDADRYEREAAAFLEQQNPQWPTPAVVWSVAKQQIQRSMDPR